MVLRPTCNFWRARANRKTTKVFPEPVGIMAVKSRPFIKAFTQKTLRKMLAASDRRKEYQPANQQGRREASSRPTHFQASVPRCP